MFNFFKRSKYKFIGEIPGIPYIYKKIRDDYKEYYSSTEELLFLSGFICLGSFIDFKQTAFIDSIYQAATKYEGVEDELEMLVKFGSCILGLELQYLNFFKNKELDKNPQWIINTFMGHLEEIKKKTEFAYFTTHDISIKNESIELAKITYKNHGILIKEKQFKK